MKKTLSIVTTCIIILCTGCENTSVYQPVTPISTESSCTTTPIPIIVPTRILEIQEGWNFSIRGDYSYTNGRVKNTGETTVTYFEVTAEYLDADGNVLDTDYTNCGENVRPRNMKEFEIMHKHSKEYKKIRLFVNREEY